MVNIRPFSAIHYTRHAELELSKLIAPPYDVLDERGKAGQSLWSRRRLGLVVRTERGHQRPKLPGSLDRHGLHAGQDLVRLPRVPRCNHPGRAGLASGFPSAALGLRGGQRRLHPAQHLRLGAELGGLLDVVLGLVELAEALQKQFDLQQKRRDLEVAHIEAQLKKLREVMRKRGESRQTIIDKRLDQMRQVIHERTAPKPPPSRHRTESRSAQSNTGTARTSSPKGSIQTKAKAKGRRSSGSRRKS